jgi:alkanesulfonate monooxygenase SsuD/methylene tetrahydromethanopterin reductase-like flavin-dependent oxidoreductase (luciferase family)
MPVEFLGIAATHNGSETTPRTGPAFDKEYTLRLARAHEDFGWDRILFAYGSGSPEPGTAAAYVAAHTSTLGLLLAHRPNVSYPTFAAKEFATLDQISDGRLAVHFITGGDDREQAREGDRLPKDERYARTREYIEIVKRAWTEERPFDHHGAHYRFEDFVSDVRPVQRPRPNVSFGGSSPAAYAAGGAVADIYALWGEPLAQTARRELLEETGYRARDWRVLADYFSSPGILTERLRVFLARGLDEVPAAARDFVPENEEAYLRLQWVPLDHAVSLVLAGELHNGVAVAGLLAAHAASRNGFGDLRDVDAPER